jgi:uncharacterized protein YijF (DUF1287 family)
MTCSKSVFGMTFVGFAILTAFFANTAESEVKDFVRAARKQIGRTLFYDSSYKVIDYPNGDIPIDRGVCTDVIVRALRVAYHYDLQEFVHEDMKKNFSKYPQIWGLNQPDKNIDHRRVPNVQTFFERNGWSLPLSNHPSKFKPGDIVTCIVPPNLPHIMIVSDRRSKDDIPLVIHNIGNGTQEEDRLFEFELTGHYRMNGLATSSEVETGKSRRLEQSFLFACHRQSRLVP